MNDFLSCSVFIMSLYVRSEYKFDCILRIVSEYDNVIIALISESRVKPHWRKKWSC